MKLINLFESPPIELPVDKEYTEWLNAYLDDALLELIKKNQDSIRQLTDIIFAVPTKPGPVYYIGSAANLPIVAVGVDWEKHDGKRVLVTAKTKRFDGRYSKAALALYRYLSNNINPWIMCDTHQSSKAKGMWQKWLLNPKKYKIDEIYMYDTDSKTRIDVTNNTINYYWGGLNSGKDIYRIIAKF